MRKPFPRNVPAVFKSAPSLRSTGQGADFLLPGPCAEKRGTAIHRPVRVPEGYFAVSAGEGRADLYLDWTKGGDRHLVRAEEGQPCSLPGNGSSKELVKESQEVIKPDRRRSECILGPDRPTDPGLLQARHQRGQRGKT